MNLLIKTLAAAAACTVLATGAFAHSTVVPTDNEPAPRLIVEPPPPGPLARGVVFIPYRVENLRILPVGGAAKIILGGLPRGQHKLLIEVVDPEGNVFTGQTVTFNSPGKPVRP
jgi:hypothetical protein